MADERTFGCVQGAAPEGDTSNSGPTKGLGGDAPAKPKKAKAKAAKEPEEKGD